MDFKKSLRSFTFCLRVILVSAVVFTQGSVAQELIERLTIVEPTTAQILSLYQKSLGTAVLPLGGEYKFLGVVEGRYLVSTGQTHFLVEPLATDYMEQKLLVQLGWTPEPPPAVVAVEPEVVIYTPEASPMEIRHQAERERQDLDQNTVQLPERPFRRIDQSLASTSSIYTTDPTVYAPSFTTCLPVATLYYPPYGTLPTRCILPRLPVTTFCEPLRQVGYASSADSPKSIGRAPYGILVPTSSGR